VLDSYTVVIDSWIFCHF